MISLPLHHFDDERSAAAWGRGIRELLQRAVAGLAGHGTHDRRSGGSPEQFAESSPPIYMLKHGLHWTEPGR